MKPVDRGRSIALIAGAGQLPIQGARQWAETGGRVVALGFKGLTSPDLASSVSSMNWCVLGQLASIAQVLRDRDVEGVLLVGKVPKSLLFSGDLAFVPDEEAISLLASRAARSDDGIMTIIADWLESGGFNVLDQSVVLAPMLAPAGVLTRRKPDRSALTNLEAGRPVIDALGRAGVGQCVVMKEGAVLAVEAIEGTDETIRRAGGYAGNGATVIKCLRAGQDLRFDLPTIGPDTIRTMAEVGAVALAVEAGATLVLEGCIAEADRANIAVWGFDAGRGAQ